MYVMLLSEKQHCKKLFCTSSFFFVWYKSVLLGEDVHLNTPESNVSHSTYETGLSNRRVA
jgi:hypothetical protein